MTTDVRQPGALSRRGDRLLAPADAPSLALSRRLLGRSLLVLIVAALLLFVADVLLLALNPRVYQVDVGNYRDKFFLTGAYFQEATESGETYRWTQARSALHLSQIGVSYPAVLSLDLGGRPEPGTFTLTLNGEHWLDLDATVEPRRYRMLLPPPATAAAVVGIESSTFTIPGDPRELGVKLVGFSVALPGSALPLPLPAHYLAQFVLLLAAQLTALRLGWGWRAQALLLGLLAIALAVLLSTLLLFTSAYLPSLAVAGVAIALLTWLLLPLAERHLSWVGDAREIRLLWALTLVACAIRVVAVLYPTFDGQDLGRNVDRLVITLTGRMVIISGSSEFADGLTIYPTGPYIALIPLVAFTTDLRTLLEGWQVLLEGTGAFFVALLVRRLGGSRDAARLGLVLYAGNLASFSGLVYSFSAQIFGQWLSALLALILLSERGWPGLRAWGLAILVLMIGVYSHIGVAILGISWVGLMLLLSLRRPSPDLWRAIGLFAASVLVAVGLLYIEIAAVTLTHAGSVVQEQTSASTPLLPGASPLVIKGARLAFTDVGLLLMPIGFFFMLRRPPTPMRALVPIAWLITALLYLAVNLLFEMQVRYFYFLVPLALSAIALVLGQLAERGRAGRLVAWALALALAAQGIALWFSTAFGDGEISMTPLTH